MKKLVPVLLGSILVTGAFAQTADSAKFVLNNNPYVVFNAATADTTYLVISNPKPNAITTIPAGAGNIVTERERNSIRWINAVQTGTYTIPFTSSSNVKIPLVVTKTTAGSGAAGVASMVLSTYNWQAAPTPVPAFLNSGYLPSDVTHFHDNPTGTGDNSANAIDRFWIIAPSQNTPSHNYAYTTPPAVTLTFNYDPADLNLGPSGNVTLNSSQMGAQRFHTSTQQWGDMLPQGTLSTNQVSNVVITPANFYRSWTIASTTTPLPIELVSWTGDCKGNRVELEWTTASEQDNDHFTIEKSADARDWTEIGEVQGAGNSSSMLHYSFTDENVKGLAYYRLSQTDIDGTTKTFDVIAAGCDADDGIAIVNAWDDGTDLNVVVSSSFDGLYDLTLLDAQGKVMTVRPTQVINTGATTLKVHKGTIATGIYVVQLQDASNLMTRRVVLQ